MHNDRPSPFSRPETVMRAYLTPEERKIYDDRSVVDGVVWVAPSIRAFLLRHWIQTLQIAVLLLLALVVLVIGGFGPPARFLVGLILVILGLQYVVLLVRLWFRTYTRYVITPERIFRMEGIINRSQSAIQWGAITDVSESADIWGQLLGYGNLTIETANEASKFKELHDVPWPGDFSEFVNIARRNKAHPPDQRTPLTDAALGALVSIEKMLTGGLVVERAPRGGWRLKKSEPPPVDRFR